MTRRHLPTILLLALAPAVTGCDELLPLRRPVATDTATVDTTPVPPPRPAPKPQPRDTTSPAELAAAADLIRSELRRLVVREATFFAETGSYTDDLGRLRFVPAGETEIEVVHASNDGWAAVGKAPVLGNRTCVIFVGRPRVRVATARSGRTGREGVPVCDAVPRPPVASATAPQPAAGSAPAAVTASAQPGPAADDTTNALDLVDPTVLMRVDLRNLARSQESYFANQGVYARRIAPLQLRYLWHRGVSVRILHADTGSWAAEAVHERAPGKSCLIWVGSPPPEAVRTAGEGIAPERSGVPVCDQ